ncbi:MAG: hypothetical protein ACOY94_20310 [Bacillota bacterium]
MRKGLMITALLGAVLLVGCTPGATSPETGMASRLQEVQRDLGVGVTVEVQHRLKSGEELAIVSYKKKGNVCGAGVVDMGSMAGMEGDCSDPLSPAQSVDQGVLAAYGYMVPGSAARVVLRWEDGTEAEAKLGQAAFYYIAEGDKLPRGKVSLTAYDKDGKVIHTTPTPAPHKH